MAERMGKHIDTNIFNIELHIIEYDECEYGEKLYKASFCEGPEDDQVFDKTVGFDRQEDTKVITDKNLVIELIVTHINRLINFRFLKYTQQFMTKHS
jgi:hypothetical protein